MSREPALQSEATSERLASVQRAIARVVKGKEDAIRLALGTLLARGHLLIEDVPGVGKTTLAHALARSFRCSFQRIQFTSDMLPGDVIGVSVYSPATREFEFKPGPIFANIVVADEINRTTPKTQSALLEAMNESQVTVDNRTHALPKPFMVVATQNPVEHHGTYPLPESQMDRFLMRIRMGYPARDSEKAILRNHAADHFSEWTADRGPGERADPQSKEGSNHHDRAASAGGRQTHAELERPAEDTSSLMDAAELIALQQAVTRVKVEESLLDYALEVVDRTRQTTQLNLGVSPRGSVMLQRAAQAMAFLEGRDYCLPDDFKRLIVPVFAHRVVVSSRYVSSERKSAQAETILCEIIETTRVPM